jgi:MFS transporter, FSR family, fosmidomycin resistance protein
MPPVASTSPDTAFPDTREPSRQDRHVVGVISVAHGCSHFFHLIVAPVFPWLKAEFALSYAELGLLMTVFFVVSGVGQAAAGFVVDRIGALPVLVASLALFVLAALVLAIAPGYGVLVLGCALAGLGNASFHPVDYSVLNARIAPAKLGKAYAVHGVAGNLGWALAPVYLVTITQLAGWRTAMLAAALLAAAVLALVWHSRVLIGSSHALRRTTSTPGAAHAAGAAGAANASPATDTFAFLRLPAVWMSFLFFLSMAIAGGAIQSFGPESARVLHGVAPQWAALCLTLYMLASAGGMLVGGFVLSNPEKAERGVAAGFGCAAVIALAIGFGSWPGWAIPVLFATMGFCVGAAGPSRDLLVRRATPPGATGRVYGTVYSGLDAGLAVSPAFFGMLMDRGMPTSVWIGVAFFQGLLILGAVRVAKLARPAPPVTATA